MRGAASEEEGFFYFVSRLGDTYRWKGENVSATEVTNAISTCDGVANAAVYPVQVPGHEGSAGMAIVTPREGQAFSLDAVFSVIQAELPPSAFPLFIRVGDGQQALTETYKLSLAALKAQGYSLALVDDPLFVLDPSKTRYVVLTEASLADSGIPPFEAL